MGLEAVTGIWDLVAANPVSTDKRRQGDDHIRNIKTALLNTFPNITAPVTATHTQLNTAGAQFARALFVNEVRMYYGDPGNLPTGWHVCDGTNGTPDMRNLVPVGAGSTYALGATMGATTPTTSSGGGHTPTGTIGATALTEEQMPAHSHFTVVNSTNPADGHGAVSATQAMWRIEGSGDDEYNLRGSGSDDPTVSPTSEAGEGATHTHTFTGDAVSAHTHTVSALQPGRALHFVMYTGV